MASAELQAMHTDLETSSEAEEALLGDQKVIRLRRFFVMGLAFAGLVVAALALWTGSNRLLATATLSSLQQKSETVDDGPTKCYMDSPMGNLMVYDMPSTPGGVCAKYTYDGKVYHIPSTKDTCDSMKQVPATYKDVTCCSEDLCNQEKGGEEIQLPSKCYMDSPTGNLAEYDMSSTPDGVCAKYTYNGKVYHVPSTKGICDSIKQVPATYKDVTCCYEDLCNKEKGGEEIQLPSKCYMDSPMGNLAEHDMSSIPDGVCAKYTLNGKVYHVPTTKGTCDSLKQSPGTLKDVTCCYEDLCNHDKPGKGSEAIPLPSKCYTDGPMGNLMDYDMASTPDGVCAKYTYDGKVYHVPSTKGTCDSMKQSPATYKDVTCCYEDRCNGD